MTDPTPDPGSASLLPPFVELAELARLRRSWTLVDARLYLDGRSERDGFTVAHLPDARFLDFSATLADPPGPDASRGRHPLPSPERFATGLSAAGLSDGETIVAYDDMGGVMAARLIWLLRVLGEDAALLAPVPDLMESGPVRAPAPGHFTPRPWPTDRFVDAKAVASRDSATVLLDARDAERYAGAPDALEPRFGHIPGAVNLPCRANLGPDGALIDLDLLEQRFSAAGIETETEVISSCGSGVTACHNLLVLEQLQRAPGRLYPGSFSEWSRDRAREIATGS